MTERSLHSFSCLKHSSQNDRTVETLKYFCIFRTDMMTMTIQKPDSRYEYKVIMSSLLWVSICKHSEPFTFVSGCGDNDWRQCGIVSKNVKHLITGFVSGPRIITKPLLWTGNILDISMYFSSNMLDARCRTQERTGNVGISIIAWVRCLYSSLVRI